MSIAEGMSIVLALLLLAVLLSLIWRHRMPDSSINLDHLLIGEDGKTSKSAVIMFGAFFLSSWVIAFRTLESELTGEMFAAYMAAWVAPTLTHIYRRPSKPTPEKKDA